MFQLTLKGEPAHTTPATTKAPPTNAAPICSNLFAQALKKDRFLSPGPEDCEPSVEPEDFGKGGVGVGVEVESEYDLELRIGGNVGRPSLLTVPNKTVRW
jgi:hypothetical protein